jgi:predicted Zn-dependent protease
MEDEARRSPATIAALAGSLLLAIAAPQAGMAAITATTAGAMQTSINYTRSNEKEADRFGMATLAKAGFDVQAMPRFFGRLAEQYRYASTPPAMLLTHPLPEARLTDSRLRAQRYSPVRLGPSIEYHLAKARVIARYAGIDSAAALDWYARKMKKAPEALRPALEYGQALVYLDTNQLDKAEPILLKLLKQDALNEFYLDALSDLFIARQQPEKAIQMLKKALDKKPDNPVLTINYANALTENRAYNQALPLLQRYTHNHPQDINGWQLLAKASAEQGITDQELASRAEMFALRANWDKAIQYYTKASQLVELGSLKQARYDARIDELLVQREKFQSLH